MIGHNFQIPGKKLFENLKAIKELIAFWSEKNWCRTPKKVQSVQKWIWKRFAWWKHELRKKLERGVIALSISVQTKSWKEDHLPESHDFVPKNAPLGKKKEKNKLFNFTFQCWIRFTFNVTSLHLWVFHFNSKAVTFGTKTLSYQHCFNDISRLLNVEPTSFLRFMQATKLFYVICGWFHL